MPFLGLPAKFRQEDTAIFQHVFLGKSIFQQKPIDSAVQCTLTNKEGMSFLGSKKKVQWQGGKGKGGVLWNALCFFHSLFKKIFDLNKTFIF